MSINYTNSESAKTRVRKALKYNFSKITETEGYRTNIGDIFENYTETSKIANWPAVVILPGPERVVNEDMSDNLLHKELLIVGLAYLREAEDAHLTRETFLADIETMIGNNFTLQNEAGDDTCMIAWMGGSEPFGFEANKPQIGFAFSINIRYRQDILDATVTA